MLKILILSLLMLGPATACAQVPMDTTGEHRAVAVEQRLDHDRLIADLRALAADSMEGRMAGTPGGARARSFLVSRFEALDLETFGDGYEHAFRLAGATAADAPGVNVVGYVRGSRHPDRYIVLTAHYDHLGVQNGRVFNGADDNASGTSALLALAAYLQRNRPEHSVVFAALDAEEGSVHGGAGLQGARAWIADPPVPLDRIVLNVNMDMISRSDRDELYAAGTYHYPELTPHVERVAARAPLRLLRGHDRPDLPGRDDWTMASDHGAFHEVGIPFLYFGVEDHEDYHRPTDTFDNIQPDFFARAAETVLDFVLEIDQRLEGRRPDRGGAS